MQQVLFPCTPSLHASLQRTKTARTVSRSTLKDACTGPMLRCPSIQSRGSTYSTIASTLKLPRHAVSPISPHHAARPVVAPSHSRSSTLSSRSPHRPRSSSRHASLAVPRATVCPVPRLQQRPVKAPVLRSRPRPPHWATVACRSRAMMPLTTLRTGD